MFTREYDQLQSILESVLITHLQQRQAIDQMATIATNDRMLAI